MTLLDLIKKARAASQDMAKPYLWSDDEWKDWANEAEQEACRRARLIVDSENFTKAVKVGGALIDLDDRILFVRRAKLASVTTPIRPIHLADLDRCNPGWESYQGLVSHYIPDYQTGKLRLFRIPTVADTLSLTVVRMPMNDMDMGDEPEIAPRLHRFLSHWMLYRAYLKQDSDGFDADKAGRELGLFEKQFGPESTAMDETWIQHNHGYDDYEGLY